jgi:hypothetical protein
MRMNDGAMRAVREVGSGPVSRMTGRSAAVSRARERVVGMPRAATAVHVSVMIHSTEVHICKARTGREVRDAMMRNVTR